MVPAQTVAARRLQAGGPLRRERSSRMSSYTLVDTYPAFRTYWRLARERPVNDQIEAWRRDYLGPWPELLRQQISNYRAEGVDWGAVARLRIFPTLDRLMVGMSQARAAIRKSIPLAVDRLNSRLPLDFPVTFVIYVGIGCGAGWATTFEGRPAVLFGLENAAELGWTDPDTAVALVEHELAHVVHERWRRDAGMGGLDDHRGPWWKLYVEGFATRCELSLGGIGRHHSTARSGDWLAWCRRNRRFLSSKFLASIASRSRWNHFFGSWFRIRGQTETGYYLGSEIVREWEERMPVREISTWTTDQIRRRGRASLERFAFGG